MQTHCSRGSPAAVILLLALVAAPAPAQSTRDGGPGGWVATAYVGAGHTTGSSLRISQPALGTDLGFDGVEYEGRSFDPPLYYGLRGGYFFPGALAVGVEAEFFHLKVSAKEGRLVRASGTHLGNPLDGAIPLESVVQQYSISHGLNYLLVNVAARRGFGRDSGRPVGRLIVTGRAGVGPTIPHTESTIDGLHREQYEPGRVGWQVAGSAEINLCRGLYAIGEYKFTRTRQRGTIFAGEAEALMRSHHGVFGLSWHF